MKTKNRTKDLRTNVRAGDNPGMGPYDATDGWTCRQMPPRMLADGVVAIDQVCEQKTT